MPPAHSSQAADRQRLQSTDVAESCYNFPVNEVRPMTADERYRLPTLSSLLPAYTNSEGDYIAGAFSTGAMQLIHDMPAELRPRSVIEQRQAKQQAALELTPGPAPSQSHHPQAGLFSHFEYVPMRLEQAEEAQSHQRRQRRALRLQVGGKEFVPAATHRPSRTPWLDGFVDGQPYPYLTDPYESAAAARQREAWGQAAKVAHGAFMPACAGSHLVDTPTARLEGEMLDKLAVIICRDWERAAVELYVNAKGFWVLKVDLDTIESEAGFVAYLNVLLNRHAVVQTFKLVRVVEHWHILPGDGHVYFAMRPPWVSQNCNDAHYTLHPVERTYQSSRMFQAFVDSHAAQQGQAAVA